jgi:hypothetical protein
MSKTEVAFSSADAERVLGAVGGDVVLVGGNSLILWADIYGIEYGDNSALTKDVDFLGSRKDVKEIALAVSGSPIYPSEKAITILAGQIEINTGNNTFLNIDIIRKVAGLDTEKLKARAQMIKLKAGCSFKVMHPLDVLKSRVENLATIKSKQNSAGIAQVKLALLVASKFISSCVNLPEDGLRQALNGIEYITSIGKSSAGRECRLSFGIDFLIAIPAAEINSELFQKNRYARIVNELSMPANPFSEFAP